MRNYENIDIYLDELSRDIYYQPDTIEHTKKSQEFIDAWLSKISIESILDLGCGTGFFSTLLKPYGVNYYGITLNPMEVSEAATLGRNVYEMDFSFLSFYDNLFDFLLSRHSLEHAFSAITTLMEWHRVSKRWLGLVLPNPEYHTYTGRNHMNVMDSQQAAWILRRAGWKIKKFHKDDEEIWFLCEKAPRISYEGWAKAPLSNSIYEFERDELSKNGDIDVVEYFKKRERKDEVF